MGDKISCLYDENAEIAEGSETVFYNGKPAARLGDKTNHDGSISGASSNVFIGSGGNPVYFGNKGQINIGSKGTVNIGGNVKINSPPITAPTTPTTPSLEEETTSLGLDLAPVVGPVKSIVQTVTGKDAVTGEPVSRLEEGAGIILGMAPGGKALVKCKKIEKVVQEIIIKAEEITNKN